MSGARISEQKYTDMLLSLREAFDGDDVPRKNRALRHAFDALKLGEQFLAVLNSILEWHEAGEDPQELIMRMIEVKHVLGIEGYAPALALPSQERGGAA